MKQAKLFGYVEAEPTVLTKLELAKAQALASQVESSIKPLCTKLEVVGSIRRQRPEIHDIDFVVLTSDANWKKIISQFKKPNIICAGNQLVKVNYPIDGSLFQADLYRATEETYGIVKLIRTGSGEHNIFLANYAISKGFRLKFSEGLVTKDGQVLAGKTEESVFEALGLPCPKPKEREIINATPVWLQS